MKKIILFTWFGDEKPPYVQWTLENFRQMNPGWEIKFVNYSNEQIKHYKEQNDSILEQSINNINHVCQHMYNNLAFTYIFKFLDEHKDELVIYCDLDCFPIAPFDNFIYQKNNPTFCQQLCDFFCKQEFVSGRNDHSFLGTCTSWPPYRPLFKKDIWCICNSRLVTFSQFLELHKGSVLDDTLIVWEGVFMNKCNTDQYFQRKKDFHEMKIELGDNFCLPQFTPIEHYYSTERKKLNLNATI